MKTLKLIIITVFSAFMISSGAMAQDVILFGTSAEFCGNSEFGTGPGTLYIINPQTAATQELGPIGFEGVTALEMLDDGRLVGSASNDTEDSKIAVLIQINPFSGQGGLIGQIGDSDIEGECGRAPGLTFDHTTDTLYSTGDNCENNDSFQIINQNTGQGTIIGEHGFSAGGNGLARRADSTFFAINSDDLFTIDPDTGQGTFVAQVPNGFAYSALDFHPVTGELYGVRKDGTESFLFILNPENGDVTEIGQLPDCSDGLVFAEASARSIPTLSEWALIAMAGILGLVGYLAIRKRKAHA